MRFKTDTEIVNALIDRIDKLNKGEYETTQAEKEVKEKLGVDPEARVSENSLEQLRGDVDEVKHILTDLIELAKETESLPDDPPEEEPEVKYDVEEWGRYCADVRDMSLHGKVSEKLAAHIKTTGYLEEGIASQGGATVPEQFIPNLLMIPLEQAVMRPRCWTIPTAVKSFSIPRVVDTTHSSSVFGGVVGTWTAEAGDFAEKNPVFGNVNLNAHKLTMLAYISNELLADNAVGLGAVLQRMFGEALRFFEDKGFIKGSGVNEPLGLTNCGCIDNINTTASHFYLEDAATMFANLMPGSFGRAIWIMSQSVIPELIALESLGNSANMWYGALTIKNSPEPWELLGRPIFFTEHCAALGTSTDVLLIDPTYYIILDRQGLVFEASDAPKFTSDQTTYRLKLRTDGQPWPASTLTLEDGSTTVSPVVNSHHA